MDRALSDAPKQIALQTISARKCFTESSLFLGVSPGQRGGAHGSCVLAHFGDDYGQSLSLRVAVQVLVEVRLELREEVLCRVDGSAAEDDDFGREGVRGGD